MSIKYSTDTELKGIVASHPLKQYMLSKMYLVIWWSSRPSGATWLSAMLSYGVPYAYNFFSRSNIRIPSPFSALSLFSVLATTPFCRSSLLMHESLFQSRVNARYAFLELNPLYSLDARIIIYFVDKILTHPKNNRTQHLISLGSCVVHAKALHPSVVSGGWVNSIMILDWLRNGPAW